MADWWKKFFGKRAPREQSVPQGDGKPPEKATWVVVDDPEAGPPLEVLDLRITQQLMATTTDRAIAERAMSWGSSTGAELDIAPVLARPAVDCEIRLPVDRALPDGLMFAPSSMDQKWVIAWRGGRIIAARSWTGTVEAVADARIDGSTLVIERIRALEESPLVVYGALPETFDWLLRCHALKQKLPFPVSESGGEMLENAPVTAFTAFGNVIFSAARTWQFVPPPVPLRSDGRIIHAAQAGKLDDIERAVAAGEDVDAPGTFGGYTALHVAIVRGDARMIDGLVKLGADVNRRVDRGMYALGIAIVHEGGPDVFAALERAGVDLLAANDDGFNALHAACEVGNAWAVRWLVERGHDLEPRTKRGHTPLQIASALGHLDAVKTMVELGADISASSPDGVAREIAAREGRSDVAAWLEKHS